MTSHALAASPNVETDDTGRSKKALPAVTPCHAPFPAANRPEVDVTRPADPHPVPRHGPVKIVAEVHGAPPDQAVRLTVDCGAQERVPEGGVAHRQASVAIVAGLHEVVVTAGTDGDAIPVRDVDDVSERNRPVAPDSDVHTIDARPGHGLEGTQLGPNKDGGRP